MKQWIIYFNIILISQCWIQYLSKVKSIPIKTKIADRLFGVSFHFVWKFGVRVRMSARAKETNEMFIKTASQKMLKLAMMNSLNYTHTDTLTHRNDEIETRNGEMVFYGDRYWSFDTYCWRKRVERESCRHAKWCIKLHHVKSIFGLLSTWKYYSMKWPSSHNDIERSRISVLFFSYGRNRLRLFVRPFYLLCFTLFLRRENILGWKAITIKLRFHIKRLINCGLQHYFKCLDMQNI